MFTYAHMKRVLWPVRVRVLFELFYKYTVSEERVQKVLANLNQSKASGPDSVPNWLLKEYSDILAFPITQILNASYREQRLPTIWKMADVPPLPKKKPVLDLIKDLRPILLTPCVSKVAEKWNRGGRCR